jgi:thiol-disulfide isomerase/thioredoxin
MQNSALSGGNVLRRIYLALMTLLAVQFLSASILTPNIEKTIQAAKDETEALKIIHDYISQTDDIEDLRLIQNYWLKLDPEECKLFFATLKEKTPKDMRYVYLWARSTEDTAIQIKTGRSLVKSSPDFEYGYRLLLSNYQNGLFNTPGPQHPTAQPLLNDFKRDKKYFDQYLLRFPKSEYAIYLSLCMLVWEKRVSAANKLLAKAVDLEATWLNWQFYTDYYLRTNQLLMLQTYIRRMVDTSVAAKNLSPAEKEIQFEETYLSTLLMGETFQPFLDYVNEHPAVMENQQVQKMLLMVYYSQGDLDHAFEQLDVMLTKPNDYYSWLVTDNELTSLRDDPRWTPKMAEFKRYWDLGSEKRKTAVLAGKISKPAPPWELKDVKGDIVRLEELKGSIVILDFWATWCSPCKDAMPVIDDWMKTKMPKDVKVFSINVWERDPALAAPFMLENKYAMTLLYGTNDLAKAYGIEGIPYLCVIDKAGNIRFEETGFAPELSENLSFWVESLQ